MNRKYKNLSHIFRFQWARLEIYRSPSLVTFTLWRNIRIQRKAEHDTMHPVLPSFVDFSIVSFSDRAGAEKEELGFQL